MPLGKFSQIFYAKKVVMSFLKFKLYFDDAEGAFPLFTWRGCIIVVKSLSSVFENLATFDIYCENLNFLGIRLLCLDHDCFKLWFFILDLTWNNSQIDEIKSYAVNNWMSIYQNISKMGNVHWASLKHFKSRFQNQKHSPHISTRCTHIRKLFFLLA